MPKKHLKRIAAPGSWNIKRKLTTFVTRPLPSGHAINFGLPLNIIMKEYLHYAETSKEVTHIIKKNVVLVDGKKTKEARQIVGIMDVLSFPERKEAHRLVLNQRGKLVLVKAAEDVKPCKIQSKTTVKKGKIQLGFHDGSSMITDKKEYKVGDTLVLSLPDRTVKEHLPLEKGMVAYLTGGKHIAKLATIESLGNDKAVAKIDEDLVETPKKFVFIIGTGKAVINVE